MMLTASSRHSVNQGRSKRNYRIQSTIPMPMVEEGLKNRVVSDMQEAIYKASANYPTVTHYFVQLATSGNDLLVGLQIEKVDPKQVSNIARSILRESLDSIAQQLELQPRPEVEESALFLV